MADQASGGPSEVRASAYGALMTSGAGPRHDLIPRTVEWRRGRVRLIDQRALPGRLQFVSCGDVGTLVQAIRDLVVRGAPALGAVGAFGVALAARSATNASSVRRGARRVATSRPTAVNLAWGVERALCAYEAAGAVGALQCAQEIAEADVAANRALGALGAALLPDRARVLTHCNAGSLACVGYGTALGVVRAAHEAGRSPSVWVDETRPVLQGARLTSWELTRLGIPHRLVVDAAAGSLCAAGEVDAVVVGADRIAANGDVANKIGTYTLAILARAHDIPFYVAAPVSTFDLTLATGASIPIEQRSAQEVTHHGGMRLTPRGAAVDNRAFDVTPARLVTALITALDVVLRPTRARVRALVGGAALTSNAGSMVTGAG